MNIALDLFLALTIFLVVVFFAVCFFQAKARFRILMLGFFGVLVSAIVEANLRALALRIDPDIFEKVSTTWGVFGLNISAQRLFDLIDVLIEETIKFLLLATVAKFLMADGKPAISQSFLFGLTFGTFESILFLLGHFFAEGSQHTPLEHGQIALAASRSVTTAMHGLTTAAMASIYYYEKGSFTKRAVNIITLAWAFHFAYNEAWAPMLDMSNSKGGDLKSWATAVLIFILIALLFWIKKAFSSKVDSVSNPA